MATRFKPGMKAMIAESALTTSLGKPGETVTLQQYDSTDETWRVSKTGNEYDAFWIKRKHLKPVVEINHEKEMKSLGFKIGAKVKLIKTDSAFYSGSADFLKLDGVKVGEEYTIHELSDNMGNDGKHPVIYIVLQKHGYNHPYDCFEVVKENKTFPYKPGDLVEVTTDMYCTITRGQILPVQRVAKGSSGLHAGVELNNNSDMPLFFRLDQVKPAKVLQTAPQAEEKDHAAIAKQMGFKVGDMFSTRIGQTVPYTISEITKEGRVIVIWPNTKTGLRYSISEVEKYFTDGNWIKYEAPAPKVEEITERKKVKCVTPSSKLTQDAIYSVIKEYTHEGLEFYDLEDSYSQKIVGMFKSRFIDHHSTQEQLLCIDKEGVPGSLTVGKIYYNLDKEGGHIKVKNDRGVECYYLGSRFIKVQG